MPAARPGTRVDAVGLTCPLPVLMIRKALRGLPAGALVEVRASDPLARIDIPHFCAENGHTFLGDSECGEVFVFRLRKGP
ncbi:MAG: sulfurtransferase TusA family protein [Alphaproteobacteria bacterium]